MILWIAARKDALAAHPVKEDLVVRRVKRNLLMRRGILSNIGFAVRSVQSSFVVRGIAIEFRSW